MKKETWWRDANAATATQVGDTDAQNVSAKIAARHAGTIDSPPALGAEATRDIGGALNTLLADCFALYVKTKNFHRHATLRSIGHVARFPRVADNDADFVTPLEMLGELREDHARLVERMRVTDGVCDQHADVATVTPVEVWSDEAERGT